MNKPGVVTIVVGLVALAVLGAPWMLVEAKTGHADHEREHDAKSDTDNQIGGEALSLEQIHLQMPMILKSIDQASRAVKAGQKEKALAELDKAQKMLIVVHQALGSYVKPAFVNNRCPLMDKAIDPEKVAKNLIREHKGQKVAFCCAGCLGKWDELTDAQKDAKLAKVLIPVSVPAKLKSQSDPHAGHDH